MMFPSVVLPVFAAVGGAVATIPLGEYGTLWDQCEAAGPNAVRKSLPGLDCY
jgi:hypothetical protein